MALPARSRPIPSHLLDETVGQPFEVGACTDACLDAPRATVAEAPPGVDVDALHVLGMASADAHRAYPSASGPRSALGWRNPTNGADYRARGTCRTRAVHPPAGLLSTHRDRQFSWSTRWPARHMIQHGGRPQHNHEKERLRCPERL